MDFRYEIQIIIILFLLFHTLWFNLIVSLQSISDNHFITALVFELNKMDENVCEDDIIAPWEVTKWLVLSSFIFGLPSIYGLYNGIYEFSILLIFSSIISANHWKFALHNSWRRNVDLILAKLSFFVLFIYNICYIRTYKIILYILLIPAVYCFYLSNTVYIPKSSCTKWRNFHFLFHMFCTCIGFLFIYHIKKLK